MPLMYTTFVCDAAGSASAREMLARHEMSYLAEVAHGQQPSVLSSMPANALPYASRRASVSIVCNVILRNDCH